MLLRKYSTDARENLVMHLMLERYRYLPFYVTFTMDCVKFPLELNYSFRIKKNGLSAILAQLCSKLELEILQKKFRHCRENVRLQQISELYLIQYLNDTWFRNKHLN